MATQNHISKNDVIVSWTLIIHVRFILFVFPKCSLSLTNKQAEYMCIRLYNELPKIYKVITKGKSFKYQVKKFIVEYEPYYVTEFVNFCRKKSFFFDMISPFWEINYCKNKYIFEFWILIWRKSWTLNQYILENEKFDE